MRSIISTIAALALALPTTFSFGSVRTVIAFAVPAALVTMTGEPAEAGRGGGRGGGRAGRGGSGGRSVGKSRHKGNQSVNRNVKRNVDVDIDRNIDVDVDHRHDRNFGAGVVTGLAIGAVVNNISNHSSCVTHDYGDISYQYCDDVWYQPRYSGSNVTYIVVNNPG